jgi:hypothetical protein
MWGGSDEKTATAASAEDDLPDWLRDATLTAGAEPSAGEAATPAWMRDAGAEAPDPEAPDHTLTGPAADSIPPTPPSASPALPDDPASRPQRTMTDWLSAVPGESAGPSDDVPDWLKDLAEAPSGEAETPDWLKAQSPPPPTAEPPTGEPPAPAEGPATPAHRMQVLPPWLRPTAAEMAEAAEAALAADLGTETGPPAEEPEPPAAPAQGATPAQPPPGQAPPGDENVPDWLNNLLAPSAEAGAGGETPAGLGQDPEATLISSRSPKKKMTDWLGATPAGSAEAPPPEDETVLPDWLSALAAGTAVEPEPASPAGEVPDWLKTAGSGEPPAEIPRAPTPAITPAAEDSLPEWLQALRPDAPEAAELPGVPTDQAGEMPSWLTELASGMPSREGAGHTAELTPAPSPAPTDDETLAWLGQLSAAPADEAAAAETLAAGTPTLEPAEEEAALDLSGVTLPAESPDWLAELAAATSAPGGEAAIPAEPAAMELAAGEPAEGELVRTPEQELPEWLRTLRGLPAEEVEAEAEDLPDWLRTLRGLPPKAPTPGAGEPARFEDAPAEAEAEGQPEVEPAAAGPAPERADLPAWLAAMRPIDIDQPVASEADAYEETLGVLAGMRGVLRAEPVVAQPQQAAAPVHRLEVTDTQAANAQLLIDLLQSEATPQPVRRSGTRLSSLVERWLIFALLALAIGLAQFQWPGLFPLPQAITPEAEAESAYQAVVEAGAAGTGARPALVAFDYEPAQQGELSPGAQVIVRQLLAQGVPVVAVSARPAGAAVGQQVLEQTAAELAADTEQALTYGTEYLNLGFLPGGPVGLAQFAAGPRAAFQNDFTGALGEGAVWQAPALAGVQALGDFGLIVLVTDTPQATRAWVEQAQQYAPQVKMVAVVSASAEPLVRPYAQGGGDPQLDGVVAGLAGAARYEQHAGLPGTASARWPALGGGLLAAALIIAAGNLVFGALRLVRRKR